ncbi:MAG: hypothetical protein SFU25_07880 [Candidatus Caenarcaniphilales bacterium]|nr:hypothetical protein [Candidatus Caenarcaniphilales bacterium]
MDVSSNSLNELTYTNTGDSISTSPHGEATGNGSVTDPSTETSVGLTLYLPKSIAMAINTRQVGSWAPGGIFGAATIPLSRFAVREDRNQLQTGNHTEFIIKGLVASNQDNVTVFIWNSPIQLFGPGGSFIFVSLTGYTGSGTTGYESNTMMPSVISGSVPLDANGYGGFRFEGDVTQFGLDSRRAGVYTGDLTIISQVL